MAVFTGHNFLHALRPLLLHPRPSPCTTLFSTTPSPPPSLPSMAEWAPPPPPPPPPPPSSPHPPRDDPSAALVPPAPTNTYVVQVPKDQIYRVPPPEHAALIQRYRTDTAARRGPFSSGCCRGLCIASLLILLLAFLVGVLYLAVRPRLPEFSVTTISIQDPRRHSNPRYEFAMNANNGNRVMAVRFYRGGSASLIHQKQEIASGHISQFEQNAGESTSFRIIFTGKDSLPRELQKKDAVVNLQLLSDMPMKMKMGGLSLPGMDLYVACEVKVKKTSKGMKISTQSCKSSLD